jgi:hypothetical protein
MAHLRLEHGQQNLKKSNNLQSFQLKKMPAILSLFTFLVCFPSVRATDLCPSTHITPCVDKIVTGAGIDWRWSSDAGKCRFVRGPRA